MPLVDLDPTNEVGLSALAAAFVRPERPGLLLYYGSRDAPGQPLFHVFGSMKAGEAES